MLRALVRHLEGRVPDASAGAGRQNRLPFAEARLPKGQERAEVGHREAAGDLIGNLTGQRREVAARNRSYLGEGAVLGDATRAGEEQDPLAGGEAPGSTV